MGRSECATSSVGIKILVSDLLAQLETATLPQIQQCFMDGFIEDENGFFNEAYKEIVNEDVDLPLDAATCKEYLTQQFRQRGSYIKSKLHVGRLSDVSKGCLMDKYLLVPLQTLLRTERWGYNREGINGRACPLDLDTLLTHVVWPDLRHTQRVFIVRQRAD